MSSQTVASPAVADEGGRALARPAYLARFAPQILGLTRILVGILFASHGAQKVLGAFGGPPPGAPVAILWIAGLVELVGGALLVIGLFSRSAAFVSSGLMAFAYFMGHAPQGFWPILNGGELAIVYSWLFLYLSAQGPGAWAVDNVRGPSSLRTGSSPRSHVP